MKSSIDEGTQTVLGGFTSPYIHTLHRCVFPIVYMCQKLRQFAGSRQSYCNNRRETFLDHHT